MLEKTTVFMERMMTDKRWAVAIGVITAIAPLYFLKTLYVIWFGPMEVFIGYQSESMTWFLLAVVDGIGFLTTLPAREKGRIMQVVMALWTIEMFLIYLATLVR